MLPLFLSVLLLGVAAAGIITTATAILKATHDITKALDDLARR